MNRVLRKRIFRDIKENFRRWLALFLMIVLGMYVVVAVVGAAENLRSSVIPIPRRELSCLSVSGRNTENSPSST